MTTDVAQAIAWRADFATGVAIIDDQHRVLVKMLNDASAQLTDASPLKDYEVIVQGLLNYAAYHFKTEEGLMATHGYDKARTALAVEHIKQHKGFAEKVFAANEQIKAGTRIPKKKLVDFLTAWLTNHILHTDKVLGAFLRDKLIQGAAGKA